VPRLGEVLGALLTDVVRARLAADELTAQALAAYRADPVLSSMSVPRVTVSNMTIRLRYITSAVETPEPRPVDVVRANTTWNTMLRTKTVPGVLSGDQLAKAQQSLVDSPIGIPQDALDRCRAGELGPIVDLTASELFRRVPATDLRQPLQAAVQRDAGALGEELREQQAADQALRSHLEVEVAADKLAATSPEAVQTLEFTISLNDVEEIIGTPAEGEG
jgi:hypothetical protein